MPIIRPSRFISLIALSVLSVALSSPLVAQAVPVSVERVEPPAWRLEPSSDLMLRLSGRHLEDVVSVKVKHKGVHVIHVESPDGNHLLVLLRISADATPGTMMLQVSTRFMTTFAAVPMFEENATLPARGELTADK
jgi:hypothetical protein